MYFSICVKSWGPVYSCTEGKSAHRLHIAPGLSYVRHEIIHTVQLRQPMINDIIMWQPCQKHDSISIQKKIIKISWSWLLKLSWGPMICVSPDVHIYRKHFTRARHRSTQLCEVELLHAPTYRTCRVPRVSTMFLQLNMQQREIAFKHTNSLFGCVKEEQMI